MLKLPDWLTFKSTSLPPVPKDCLRALEADLPCGPSLEYDNEFAVLQSRLRPRGDVQFGEFVHTHTGPDWGLIERDAWALLCRSRDLQVLVWYTRARCVSAGAAGLLEGLNWMLALLEKWPEDVHPQLTIDGDRDVAVRANAVAALADPEGLLAEVRLIQVSGGSGTRLTVRDVERAFAKVKSQEALNPEAVKLQLSDLHARGSDSLQQLLICARIVDQLQRVCVAQMGTDAPQLGPLINALASLAPTATEAAGAAAPVASKKKPPTPSEVRELAPILPAEGLPTMLPDRLLSPTLSEERARVLAAIRHARRWVEENEPSSPVAVLLKQAERLWGKRFSEVANTIPADLLARWDEDQ